MSEITLRNHKKIMEYIRKYREVILFLVDIGIVLFAYFIGFFFMLHTEFLKDLSTSFVFLGLLPIVIIIYSFTILKFSLHGSLWKYFGINEIQKIIYVNMLAGLLTILVVIPLGTIMQIFNKVSSLTVSMTCVVSSLFTILGMFSLRFIYRMYREKKLNNDERNKKVLIVGAGDAGYLMLKDLTHTEGVRVVGFVDDKLDGKMISGVKVIGKIQNLENLIVDNKIDSVYLAIPSADMSFQKQLIERLSDTDVNVKVMHKKRHEDHRNGAKFTYPVNDVSIDDLLGRGEVSLDFQEITSYLQQKVIMITGAAGSIGSELCRQILKFEPKQLIMVDVNENELYMLERELYGDVSEKSQIFSFIASIREIQALDEIMREYKPDVVFHAAAHKHVPLMETRPQEAIKNNVIGTKNVIDVAIKNNVSRFVLISTDKAVNPTNIMGATKRITELILQSRANNGVTQLGAVRFGNVLGSNGSVIPIFKEQIKNGGPVTLTHKEVIRYFMTIPEAVQLVLQAGFYANQGEIFVLDMGKPVKIYDLAKKMIRLSGYQPGVDIEIKEVGLREGEKMFEELNLASETVNKTKHDLIFETHSKDIDREMLEKEIQELEAMSLNNVDISALRKKIFELIQKWN